MGLITSGEVKKMELIEYLRPFFPAFLGAGGQVARILLAITREASDVEGEPHKPSLGHLAKTLLYGAIGGAVIGSATSMVDPVFGMFTALGAGWQSADAIESGETIVRNLIDRFKAK